MVSDMIKYTNKLHEKYYWLRNKRDIIEIPWTVSKINFGCWTGTNKLTVMDSHTLHHLIHNCLPLIIGSFVVNKLFGPFLARYLVRWRGPNNDKPDRKQKYRYREFCLLLVYSLKLKSKIIPWYFNWKYSMQIFINYLLILFKIWCSSLITNCIFCILAINPYITKFFGAVVFNGYLLITCTVEVF